ncbi:MAG: metallophosphoesterase family protein [Candidatus Paceibacterota bacterium]
MTSGTPDNECRLIAIGDVHGHPKALRGLVELVGLRPDDVVVMLGDYVNRGPDSRGVIEFLIELGARCQLVPLLGNHDEMMLGSRGDVNAESRWRYEGGTAVLRQYGPRNSVEDVSKSHWDFLASCQPAHETDAFIFVHANYSWYDSVEHQPSSLLRWISIDEEKPQPHTSGKTVILGHTPGPIRDYGFCRCLDTGCGFGGRLTAMDVFTKTCWQVTEDGEAVEPEPVATV